MHVINGTRVTCYYSRLQEYFPKDKLAADWHLESYIGAPFLSADGKLIGLLVIMDEKPMKDLELFRSVIEFCAARINSEYRRMASEESFRAMNEKLEKLVSQRTHDLEKSFKELRETQKQLISQEKLATLGSLTLGIAHELKNPLNIIINSTQLLNGDGVDIQERKKLTSMIWEHGQRANSIITKLLLQARQEVSIKPEWHNLSELMERILDLHMNSLVETDWKPQLVVHKKIDPTFL